MPRAVLLALGFALLVGCTENVGERAETANEQGWPLTCDGAIAKLSTELPQSEQADLAAMKRDDLILLHHGFGTGIRNEFGLWGGNFALIESCSGSRETHPDDVSMIIIERLWVKLQ